MFISPEDLRLPRYVKTESLEPTHQVYTETDDLEAELPHLDVLYMTRIQQERFFNEEEYLRLKGYYQLDEAMLRLAPARIATRPDRPAQRASGAAHPIRTVADYSLWRQRERVRE